MKDYVLDANAVLRYLKVVDGGGGERVQDLFLEAQKGQARLLMSVINMGEVLYVLIRNVGEPRALEYLRALQHAVTMVDADVSLTMQAATLKHRYGLGYADSFAAAQAMGRKGNARFRGPILRVAGQEVEVDEAPQVRGKTAIGTREERVGDEKRALVLLSGGLDSTTVAAVAKQQGFAVYALSFDYGQNHRVELEFAARVAKAAGVARHAVIKVDLRAFGGSALTDSDLEVPKGRSVEEMGHGVPVTYVPARNTVFLALALAWAETLGATDIFIGVNALDYSGYPDCRPEFIAAFETMANLATKMGTEDGKRIKIHTPLIALTKKQIVELGLSLGVDYSNTVTCYDPSEDGAACGACDACLLRLKGFAEAGVKDPARYM